MSKQNYDKINNLEKQSSASSADEYLEPLLEDGVIPSQAQEASKTQTSGNKIKDFFKRKPSSDNKTKYQKLSQDNDNIEGIQQGTSQGTGQQIVLQPNNKVNQQSELELDRKGQDSIQNEKYQSQQQYQQQKQYQQQPYNQQQSQNSYGFLPQNIVQGQPVRMFPQQFSVAQNLPSSVDEWYKYSKVVKIWGTLSIICMVVSILMFRIPLIGVFGVISGCVGTVGYSIVRRKAQTEPISEFVDTLYYFSLVSGIFQGIHLFLIFMAISGLSDLTYCRNNNECFSLALYLFLLLTFYATHMGSCFQVRKVALHLKQICDENTRGAFMVQHV